MGVALYFIDKLALRAGHEKDEDEADTVGCCTLKVGQQAPCSHVTFREQPSAVSQRLPALVAALIDCMSSEAPQGEN